MFIALSLDPSLDIWSINALLEYPEDSPSVSSNDLAQAMKSLTEEPAKLNDSLKTSLKEAREELKAEIQQARDKNKADLDAAKEELKTEIRQATDRNKDDLQNYSEERFSELYEKIENLGKSLGRWSIPLAQVRTLFLPSFLLNSHQARISTSTVTPASGSNLFLTPMEPGPPRRFVRYLLISRLQSIKTIVSHRLVNNLVPYKISKILITRRLTILLKSMDCEVGAGGI